MKKGLFIALIIALLGVGGWAVYAQQNDNQTTPQPAPNQKTINQPTTQQNETKYLAIKEWDVRLPLTNNIQDAKYSYKSNEVVYLSTDSAEKVEGCQDGTTMSLQRAKKGEMIGPSSVDEFLDNNPSALKKVGEYYYLFFAAPKNCAAASDSSGHQLLEEVRQAFADAAQKVEPISN